MTAVPKVTMLVGGSFGAGNRSVPLQSACRFDEYAIFGVTDPIRSDWFQMTGDCGSRSCTCRPTCFEWMPRRPQPSPQIYQPKVAREGLVRRASPAA